MISVQILPSCQPTIHPEKTFYHKSNQLGYLWWSICKTSSLCTLLFYTTTLQFYTLLFYSATLPRLMMMILSQHKANTNKLLLPSFLFDCCVIADEKGSQGLCIIEKVKIMDFVKIWLQSQEHRVRSHESWCLLMNIELS